MNTSFRYRRLFPSARYGVDDIAEARYTSVCMVMSKSAARVSMVASLSGVGDSIEWPITISDPDAIGAAIARSHSWDDGLTEALVMTSVSYLAAFTPIVRDNFFRERFRESGGV